MTVNAHDYNALRLHIQVTSLNAATMNVSFLWTANHSCQPAIGEKTGTVTSENGSSMSYPFETK